MSGVRRSGQGGGGRRGGGCNDSSTTRPRQELGWRGNGQGRLLGAAAIGAAIAAAAAIGCGGAPAARPWTEEEIGGGHGEELGQRHVGDEGDGEGGVGVTAGAAAGAAGETGAEGAGGSGEAAISGDAGAALRELDGALAALGRASSGGANSSAASARARLERALAALPAAAVRGLEERSVRWADSPGGVLLALHAARLWLHAGAPERAAPQLARARAGLTAIAAKGASAGAAIDAATLASWQRQTAELSAAAAGVAAAVAPTKVAVLLPLSGRFAAVGQELRRAIELASITQLASASAEGAEGAESEISDGGDGADGSEREAPARPARRGPARPGARAGAAASASAASANVQWQFLDTRGEPAAAAAAVEQAAAAGAVAILGPVGDREAVAAARRASQRGVPIALLSPGDGADLGLGVFRLGWSAQDEARAVAAWAAANDFRSVAVLSPRDDVGELAATAFTRSAAALGLTVAAQGQYDAAGGSVEADLKRFLGLVPAQNPRLAAHLRRGGKRAWQTFVPEVAFSLLYLPDRADRAALVAAFLPYLGLELRTEEIMDPLRLRRKYRGVIPQVVQLVGGAGWNQASLPARGGNAVQGAMIFDVCTAQRDDLAEDLAAQLAARLGHPPSGAAAQAHDAAAWISRAVTAARLAGRGHRAGVAAAMAQTRLSEGACGPLSIGADGEVVREPAVLQVDGEDFVLAP